MGTYLRFCDNVADGLEAEDEEGNILAKHVATTTDLDEFI